MKKYYSGGYHKHTDLVCLQVGGRADFREVNLSFESSISFDKPVDIHLAIHLLFFKAVFSLQIGRDEE